MLVYAHKITPRLQYVCAFIFAGQLGVEIKITTDIIYFETFTGPKINYSNSDTRSHYTIKPASLLFENSIELQKIICFDHDGYTAFFETRDSQFPFDLLAAVFYLLTRYEEYLPYKKDLYGRYAHENSLAFKEGFLQQPLVNIWLIQFAASLKKVYPEQILKENHFSFLPTYDIDIAWSYKNKGLLRDIGGLLLAPSMKRLQVLQGKEQDPFDCYAWLDRLHSDFNLAPIYFFLVAGNRGRYDKNNSIGSMALRKLIEGHATKYQIGIHPSWKSNTEAGLLPVEIRYLVDLLPPGEVVTLSRQHYIKFSLPETFHLLLHAGIKEDFSMGYGSINGFRASVASSFYWYDLASEKQTGLLLHPFCFMDANSFYEQGQSAKESFAELLFYYSVCKEVKGKLITIFHNNILGGDAQFFEWPAMYESFIAVIEEDKRD